MFQSLSQVGLPAKPRQAEQNDARMALKRQEQETGGRKKQKSFQMDEAALGDDTTVSVEALALFLENFLLTRMDRADSNDTLPEARDFAPVPPVAATPAARAARAYQTAYKAGHRLHTISARKQLADLPDAATNGITQEDIAIIRAIQANLARLERRGIAFVHITRGETFLGSLLSATQNALAEE